MLDWLCFRLMDLASLIDSRVWQQYRRGGHSDCFRMTDLEPYVWCCIPNWQHDGWKPERFV